MSKRILFCNVAYMQYYDFDLIEEIPKYGGSYVAETGDAYEKSNFHVCDDGIVRGFVETKYLDSSKSMMYPRKLRIENIDSHYKNANQIEDVLVIFCAHSDLLKETVIVGWYDNATVFRNREHYNGRQYNLMCQAKDAHLLVDEQRKFIVPRAAKKGNLFGFGQANVWYAKEDNAKNYLKDVIDYTQASDSVTLEIEESNPLIIPDTYKESGIGKPVLVNRYERNAIARRKCLELQGTKCVICGFDAAAIYGEEFKDIIEVHHIKAISEIGDDYHIDPSKDLIPVCPNCHTMLHAKRCKGTYPTIESLRRIMKVK